MTKHILTHHASHLSEPSDCQNKTSRWRVTGCCSAATKHTETCSWHWRGGWLWIIQSVFSQSRLKPVFGHARFCCSCEISLRENLRVKRVPLISGTDRGHTSSLLWELWFVTVVTQQLSKSRKKRLIDWILTSRQKKALYCNAKVIPQRKCWHIVIHEPLMIAEFNCILWSLKKFLQFYESLSNLNLSWIRTFCVRSMNQQMIQVQDDDDDEEKMTVWNK